jgi:superfamily II DNA or RNA helicase
MKHILSGRMLVLAHRVELIDQAIDKLKHWNPTLRIGKEMADSYADADCEVVVSCVASIGRADSTRLQRFGEFDIVVCDEAQHSVASTYMNVFEATGVLKPNTNKLLCGWTATPKRHNVKRSNKEQVTLDGAEEILSLKSVYQKIVYSYPLRKAIKTGWLVPLKGFKLQTGTHLEDVKTTAGDYQLDQLSDAVNTPRIVLPWHSVWT